MEKQTELMCFLNDNNVPNTYINRGIAEIFDIWYNEKQEEWQV